MREITVDLPTLSDEMVRRLVAVVGEDSVHVERPKVDEFKDEYWIPGDATYAASAVVQPRRHEQVQEIVRIANRYGIPIWPHSQGRNLGHGGPHRACAGRSRSGSSR